VRRPIGLHKDILRQILRLGGILDGPADQVEDRLLEFLDQLLKSLPITLADANHEGGIRINRLSHAAQQ